MADDNNFTNIYIVGAQCTGKTTLVKALDDHFSKTGNNEMDTAYSVSRPLIISEVARNVLQEHNFTAEDITSSPARALALQELILKAQLKAETAFSKEEGWFISDRSGADPIVYAKKYVGHDAANDFLRSQEWLDLKGRMNKSLVIVCEAGADWLTDDGVRLMPESKDEWVGFHQLFCQSLGDWGVQFQVLPCNVTIRQERVAFILRAWLAHQRQSSLK